MTKALRIAAASLTIVAALAFGPGARDAAAQAGPAARLRAGQRQQALRSAEVERLFDSYVAMQAQEALKLSDAQFPQFIARLRALQRARRQHLLARRQLIAELAADNSRAPATDDSRLADALRRLRDLDRKHADDLQRAYDDLDQVLDIAQQARFRVFEDAIERRKLDLMLRARQSAQQKGPTGRIPLP